MLFKNFCSFRFKIHCNIINNFNTTIAAKCAARKFPRMRTRCKGDRQKFESRKNDTMTFRKAEPIVPGKRSADDFWWRCDFPVKSCCRTCVLKTIYY